MANEELPSNQNELGGLQMISKVKQKFNYVINNITIEPIVVLYMTPIALSSFATDNLNLEKACRVNLAYNETVCDAQTVRNVSGFEDVERKIQAVVDDMLIWRNLLRYSFPAVFIIFVGSWSDRTGRRKPLLMLPIFGEFLTSIGLLLCTYYYLEWPIEVPGVIEGLFPAITGSNMVMTMAVFSYISDITTPQERTFRIGVINMVIFIFSSAGIALSGLLLNKITFYGMFSIASVSYLIALVYCWFYIKETRQDSFHSTGRNQFIILFNCDLIRETFLVLFRKREKYQRLVLCLLMCTFISVVGPAFGETTVAYLFMREQLRWDEKDAGYFASYSTLITFIGILITVSVLSKMLKLEDCIIGLLACTGKIIATFCYAFSYKGWQLYLAQTIDIFSGAGPIAVRSIVSKAVPPNELGRIFSLMGICEAIASFVFGPLYNRTHRETLEVFPGAFFFVGSIFTLIAAAAFIGIYIMLKKGITNVDQHKIELDTKSSVDKVKEQYVNENFESEEQETADSKL